MKNSEIEFEFSENGKPRIKGNTMFHFNISHTSDAMVFALSKDSIGVDIEKIRLFNSLIVKRCFSCAEQRYIYGEVSDMTIRFYTVWTRKEAYLKLIGKGLSVPLKSFSVIDSGLCSQITTYLINEYSISVALKNKNEKVFQIKEKIIFPFFEQFLS